MAKAKRTVNNSTKNMLTNIWSFVAWLTGILVALAVGFGMSGNVLTIPVLSSIAGGLIVKIAGWIVIVLALLSVLLMLIDKFSK